MQVPYSQGQTYGGANAAPVDPIISRLRPRDMLGILDQAFRLYRKNFLTFLAIVAVVFVPIEILTQVLNILTRSQSPAVLSPTTPFGGSNFQSGAVSGALTTSPGLWLSAVAVAVLGCRRVALR